MDIRVSRKALLDELVIAERISEKKTTIPILSNVNLTAEDGELIVQATDLECAYSGRISAQIAAGANGAGTICLPIKKLRGLVNSFPEGDVEITSQANNWARVSLGRTKARVAGMSPDSWPEFPKMPPDMRIAVPAAKLLALCRSTMYAISAEESRFTLNGAQLELRANGMTMVATDGHRMAFHSMEQTIELDEILTPSDRDHGVKKVLVPRRALVELQRMVPADDQLMFSVDDNHLFFEFGMRQLIVRKMVGNFPDYERVIPKGIPHEFKVGREAMLKALDQVSNFADERSRAVKMLVRPNGASGSELAVTAATDATGDCEAVLESQGSSDHVEIGVNGRYMSETLSVLSPTTVVVKYRDGQSAFQVVPEPQAEGQETFCVLMPMRI